MNSRDFDISDHFVIRFEAALKLWDPHLCNVGCNEINLSNKPKPLPSNEVVVIDCLLSEYEQRVPIIT